MRLRKNATLTLSCFALLSVAIIATPATAQESDIADPFGTASPVNAVAASAHVDREPARQDLVAPPNAPALDHQTRNQLKQLLTLEYDEEAWSDIEMDLEAKLGVNIFLDQSAKDDSLDVDEPVSLNLRNVPGDHALRIMLAEKNATYVVHAGVIKVISLDDSEDSRYFSRKVFDVTDLLGSISSWNRDFRKQQMAKPPATDDKKASATPGGSSGPVFRRAVRLSKAEHELSEVIHESVQPNGWVDAGGMCSQKWFCGKLIIMGSESVILEIDELLTELRSRDRGPVSGRP